MEELIDRITSFVTDLPIGLIIFLIAIAFSFIGRGEAQEEKQKQREKAREAAAPDPFAFDKRPRETPRSSMTFASDERRAREEREREHQEVLVFGGLEFGSRGGMFDGDEGDDRDSQWGKTQYGFDDAEWGSDSQWGSSFGDKKSSEPIIR